MFFSIPKLQEKLNDTQILRDSSDPEFMMLSLWLHWHCDSSRWIFCGWLKNIGFIHVIDIIIHITIYIMIHILYIYTYIYLYIIVILGICRICRYITFIPPFWYLWIRLRPGEVDFVLAVGCFFPPHEHIGRLGIYVGRESRKLPVPVYFIDNNSESWIEFSWF